MELNLRQLRTFLSAVRLGSFAAAGKELHATQSAVSVRIHELEAALGVRLIARGHDGVRVTPKGRALVPFAERILALAAETQSEVGDVNAMAGRLRLGACEPIALTWLADFVAAARERFPKVKLEIDKDLSSSLIAKLKRGEIDIALIAGPVADPRCISASLGRIGFCWVTSAQFPVSRRAMTPSDIRSLPLISLSQQPYEYPAIERWLEGGGSHEFVITCNDMGVAIRLLTRGLGVSLLAEISCRPLIASGKLRQLRTKPSVPKVQFVAVSLRSHDQPLISSFVRLACETSCFFETAARIGKGSAAYPRSDAVES